MKERVLILGVNGWPVRGHDASAALVCCNRDGSLEVMGAVEEERLSRNKHAYDSFPVLSVRCLLESANLRPTQIDHVVWGWDFPSMYKKSCHEFDYPSDFLLAGVLGTSAGVKAELRFLDHHLSHASSAYRCSGLDQAAVLVVDGQGESSSSSLWHGKDGQLQQIFYTDINASLGYMYGAMTGFVGFRFDQAGKTMGLAAYGDGAKYSKELLACFDLKSNGFTINNTLPLIDSIANDHLDDEEIVRARWLCLFEKICGKGRNVPSDSYSFRQFPKPYVDLAAASQVAVEKLMLHLAKCARTLTGSNNLCLAGGVALNCVANGEILQSGLFENIYVQPAAHDAGTSLGAALELAAQLGYFLSSNERLSPFLGPSFSDEQIINELERNGICYSIKNSCSEIMASLINDGFVVGVFQDRMEFGPRALGARSIIADPRSGNMQDHINSKIKFREEGRPLAPSLLEEDVENVFSSSYSSPYMNLSFSLRDKCSFPAITHVDGTTRPQTLTGRWNPHYQNQIAAFKDLTGCPLLLNTSLNCNEPILCCPRDAVKFLRDSAVDYFVFNNKIVVENK